MSYLLFYFPLMLVALTVLEVCGESEPKKIARRVARNFFLITACFFAGSVVVGLIQNWIIG